MFASSLAILAAALFPLVPDGAPAWTASGSDTLTTYVDCPLERIGTQLVRCDNLTGAGAAAPYWIPEQK
ncbi:hypothetical protein [Arthrobacter sp. MAHUQ-56]